VPIRRVIDWVRARRVRSYAARTAGAGVRGAVAELLGAIGVAEPDAWADDFVALVDGLVFDQIAGAGDRALTSERLRAVLGALPAAIGGMTSDTSDTERL
jgi:hypothetical protein